MLKTWTYRGMASTEFRTAIIADVNLTTCEAWSAWMTSAWAELSADGRLGEIYNPQVRWCALSGDTVATCPECGESLVRKA